VSALESERFFPRVAEDKSPMTFNSLFEGTKNLELLSNFVAFDIETFSPYSFPGNMEDPIVNFSLVIPLVKKGILSLAVIGEPCLENRMLNLLHRLLGNLKGNYLFTYNGTKFDIEYVVQRGRDYGLEFQTVFDGFWHVDAYRLLKWWNICLPKYNQKFVERLLGIPRVITNVSGRSYYLFYQEFLKGGSLDPMFYNIEDSFGCLRITDTILKMLRKSH
jgi:uncharacterized protein YprB with RNaseH-like and TPR domain